MKTILSTMVGRIPISTLECLAHALSEIKVYPAFLTLPQWARDPREGVAGPSVRPSS